METKSFNKQELNDFISSELYSQLENLPVSKHRALSQINNPRASDTDVLLVVQFDKGQVVGYMGILPDRVFYQGEAHKAGWLTCLWINEAYRSQNISASLFQRSTAAWEQKVFITNMVPWSRAMYQKTGIFLPVSCKTGFRGYMRSNISEILPPKGKWFKKLSWSWKTADILINIFGDLRFLFFKGYKIPDLKIDQLGQVDQQSADFIDSHNKNNWNQRGVTELNWILKYPWIIEQAKPDHNSSRYYFSSISRRFFYQPIKIADQDGTVKGFVLLCIRNNNLTIPYVFAESAYYDVIGKEVVNTMMKFKLNMVTTFHEDMALSLSKFNMPFLFKKQIKKHYFVSKKFGFIQSLNFQDGDGDCAFY